MSEPLVSIVIPCYNGERHVAECLQSLFDQTYKHCEIIVVDDGSTDGSLEILKGYGDRIRLETGPNRGACAARNRGLDLAKGEFVKFFDADDVMMPDAIATQVEAMAGLAPHEIVYGNLIDLDTEEPVFDEIRTGSGTTQDEMIYACFCRDIITGCPLHRRKFLLDHGLRFDETLLTGQEWDLHLSAAIAGAIFVYRPDVIYRYRNHDDPDRITQKLKDPEIAVDANWHTMCVACKKIITAYKGTTMPAELRIKMRRRLCKSEAKFMIRKMPDRAKSVRAVRQSLDPWWRVLLSDIRYVQRRHFRK